MAVWTVCFRRLWQRNQHRCLFRTQCIGQFAKVVHAGTDHPLYIASVGCEDEIGPKDLLFAVAQFQLKGTKDFNDLGAYSTGFWLKQPGKLHGECRTAGTNVSLSEKLKNSPPHSQRIHPPVLPKPLILKVDQHGQIEGVEFGDIQIKSPLLFAVGLSIEPSSLL